MGKESEVPRPWRASGVVTLLSDYGRDDPYAGIVKGVLLREAPALRSVVDVTHAVPPGDVLAGAFLLERSWSWFPAGTVHLAIVDPSVGTEREILAVEARGQILLAPDNGLLAPLIEVEPGALVRRVVQARAPRVGSSRTFHGRDRFAPLAAALVQGTPVTAFAERFEDYKRLERSRPVRWADGSASAEVLWVDHFGNLITNAAPEDLTGSLQEDGWRARWRCLAAGRSLAFVETYADIGPGEAAALVDSYERIEIAVQGKSAARELALGRGAPVRFELRRSR
jgi:S-adenosylmethionine hydrolase